MQKVKNRWLIALSGVVVHLSIGSAYAWSVFKEPIKELTGWEKSSISFAFSLAIFCLGISAAFMGKFVEKFGPRKTGMMAAVLFGLGIFSTGFAISLQSLPLLYLTYGIIGGIGLGSGYVTPVSTMIRWFPDRKGLATGLAIMGFGFASMVTGPIAQQLMLRFGVQMTFHILGIAYFVVMFAASQYLAKPPVGWAPDGFETPAVEEETTKPVGIQMTANEAIKTKTFWLLWFMLFLNITCGISLVSEASPMAQEITGMSATAAAAMVGVMGVFNGLGRLVWALISDVIGRKNVFTLLFVIDIVVLIGLSVVKTPLIFAGMICLIMTCYGAGFSIVPAYIGDVFGTKEVGAIHGYILTAWAAAGMFGPIFLGKVTELFHSYSTVLRIFVILAAVGLFASLAIRTAIKYLGKKKNKVHVGGNVGHHF
ncbi:MFS transporter [Enterococcus florum]|uniref:MFS transporter n=1 Tax=Enterococcus florum TaxID=2480627 RepID=A0A4P5P8I5_9ENTE|nr:OFA family MFS transporter [Enterococcus florum]GCF94345.1 MFS transporter [Enterococcus florum]